MTIMIISKTFTSLFMSCTVLCQTNSDILINIMYYPPITLIFYTIVEVPPAQPSSPL